MIDCVLLDALHLPFRGYQSQTKSQTKSQTNSHYSTQLFDLMFLSPPWGGPKYASHRSLSMEPWTSFGHAIQKLHLADTVLFYLPRNVNFQEIKFLSQTGALLQPFRQRRSIIYPSASTDLLEYSDFAQPKIHQDISNQVRFNPLWSWKTSAFALWIGNIGQRKFIEVKLLEDFVFRNYLRSISYRVFRRIQLILMQKLAKSWSYQLVDLLGRSGRVPGPPPSSRNKKDLKGGMNKIGTPITYEAMNRFDPLNSLPKLLRKIKRLNEIVLQWTIIHPSMHHSTVCILIETVFKLIVNRLWIIPNTTMSSWLADILQMNVDIQRLNNRMKNCLFSILFVLPRRRARNCHSVLRSVPQPR